MYPFKATKQPVTIDAILWDGSEKSTREVLKFMGQTVETPREIDRNKFSDYCFSARMNGLTIETLEDGDDKRAIHVASVGDYIIKGVQGEFYPCKPDIFKETYYVQGEHMSNTITSWYIAKQLMLQDKTIDEGTKAFLEANLPEMAR